MWNSYEPPDQSRPYHPLPLAAPHGHAYVAVPLDAHGLPIMPNFAMPPRQMPPMMYAPDAWKMHQQGYTNGGMNGMHHVESRGKQRAPTTKKQDKKQQNEQQRGPIMEDKIRRTVYINNIDPSATEAQIASFFLKCGPISDVRMCGDSGSKFAFIEFASVETVMVALDLNGTEFCGSSLKVLQSKTAIMPVNRELVPRSQDDIERCKRTVYVANIDKRMERPDVERFFEEICGPISNMRLLGDNAHATRIAFVEFYSSNGAQAALQCSGAILGSLPIRVSPSKTPLRPEPSTAISGDEATSYPGASSSCDSPTVQQEESLE